MLRLEIEEKRLKKEQIKLVNQLRAVKGKLNLECAHLKTVCLHPTTLEDAEWDVDRQYQCKVCISLVNSWDIVQSSA